MASAAVEDYLKAIYELSDAEAAASTSAIAGRLDVAPGSVTGMLKRLAEQGLVEHVRYYGAKLSDAGRENALRLIRRHRVIELFLVEVLGYTWDRVHPEAERLEHTASDELIARMAKVLGNPTADPHGAPIPLAGVDFEEPSYTVLAELEVGRPAVVRQVADDDPAALRYLAGMHLVPGVRVTVEERSPFNGPLRVTLDDEEKVIGRELSRRIRVEADAPAIAEETHG